MAQLTVAMALSLAPHGIRVNAIGPGSIATDMVMQLISSDEARRTVMSRTPMGRLGKPEEIAAVAAFLASDEASYITGGDGGRGRRAPGAELRGAGRGLTLGGVP